METRDEVHAQNSAQIHISVFSKVQSLQNVCKFSQFSKTDSATIAREVGVSHKGNFYMIFSCFRLSVVFSCVSIGIVQIAGQNGRC